VRIAIKFDHDLRRGAVAIENVLAERVLPTKLEPRQATVPKNPPRGFFSSGRLSTHLLRELAKFAVVL
jgi:hypothetical protein